MSDKTNQATPKPLTFDEFKMRDCYEAGDGRVSARPKKACEREKSSLLAENEKLRGLVERTKIHLEYVSKYYENPVNKQKAIDLLDEIAAALSGEQEGTPLK